jgi:anhydro-N-acetylmuramic acid kinase
MLVLGIMSGTSIDGIDYALCEVTRKSVRLVKLWTREFPKTIRARLHAVASNECSAHELAQLHHDLGRLYARQAKQLNSRAKLVGLHGQTVFHNPDPHAAATLQIGEPEYLAEALRVPVINNFRAADIAHGGQGAPLATLFHKVVFARRGEHVCVNNLGGISNVTSLDWRDGKAHEPQIIAFDTGPANVLIDLAMREFSEGRVCFDANGAFARKGRVNDVVLKRWMKHPFFRKKPPKSTGRELFGEAFWRKERQHLSAARLPSSDVVATLTRFTAESIAINYRLHLNAPPEKVVLCGGGARNPELVFGVERALRKTCSSTQIMSAEECGWPTNAVEPAAFALLAFYRWNRLPGNLPATTGARNPALLGQVSDGGSVRRTS